MKYVILNIILLFSMNCYSQGFVSAEDLETIIGKWEGSITYLDYQTNKPFSMPANLIVTQGKNKQKLTLSNIYPNEPKANNKDNIKISKSGVLLNKNKVTSRRDMENGSIQIQTQHRAKDDNKKALIQFTYTLGKDTFVIIKEVQFEGDINWIKRNEFSYLRP